MSHIRLAALLLALPLANVSAADGQTWRVERGTVRIVCPLTVGGSFEATTASISGTLVPPSSASAPYDGQFSVDLRTLDTGIELRNDHLRNRYVEVGKGEGFDTAVVSEIRMTNVDLNSFQGRTTFTGVLLLHGTKKPITGQVEIRRSASSVRVEANFPVTLTDYGIAKPSYLGIGVKNTVQARMDFTATSSEGTR